MKPKPAATVVAVPTTSATTAHNIPITSATAGHTRPTASATTGHTIPTAQEAAIAEQQRRDLTELLLGMCAHRGGGKCHVTWRSVVLFVESYMIEVIYSDSI